MRLAVLVVALFLVGCGKGEDPPIVGRWVKGNEAWVLFTPDGLVGRVGDRAQVGTYTFLDGKTLLVEEFSGEATVRNLWQVSVDEKGLDLTYPGGEKVHYDRARDPAVKQADLAGRWTANLGVGKSNLYAFDPSGRFLAVRWIRSSSSGDRERRQRRVTEAGRWRVEGKQLKLDGMRRRHFVRTYGLSLAKDELVLTSGQGPERRVRTYHRNSGNSVLR